MGRLAEDMTRLSDEIVTLRTDRQKFINDLRHDVAQELGAFVSGLKNENSAMLDGLRQDLANMFRSSQSDRATFLSDLKSEVVGIKTSHRNARAKMSEETRADLERFVSGLREKVGGLQEELAEELAGLRQDLANMFHSSQSDRATFFSDLKTEVAEIITSHRNARAKMTEETRADLERFVSGLQEKVDGQRRDLAKDLAATRTAWVSASPFEQKGWGEKPRQEIVPPPSSEVGGAVVQPEVKGETFPNLVPDDLTVIHGIGSGRRARLNEAGIFTYAQLAKATPEALGEALGPAAKLVDLDAWIEQAKQLLK